MPSRRDDLLIFLALVAVVVVTVVLAAALPAAPGPARGPVHGPGASEPPAAAAFGDRDRACAEWTDGCIVCRRDGQETACSTPGIACTRGPVQCLKRTGG